MHLYDPELYCQSTERCLLASQHNFSPVKDCNASCDKMRFFAECTWMMSNLKNKYVLVKCLY
jgi:hypothetical protein